MPQQIDDEETFQEGVVRMYDTWESARPQMITKALTAHVAQRIAQDGYRTITSRQFYNYYAKVLRDYDLVKREGIVTTCEATNVPIFIAGLESSVIAMDLAGAIHNEGIELDIGVGLDLIDHSTLQDDVENMGYRSNLVQIGGGVMRNTIQQTTTGGYIVRGRPWSTDGGEWYKRHRNVVLITTDTGVPYGGASSVPMVEHNPHTGRVGSENITWGKFDPHGARAAVYGDATFVLPYLLEAMRNDPEMYRILAERRPVQFRDLDKPRMQILRPAT